VALQQLRRLESADGSFRGPAESMELPRAVMDSLTELDVDLAEFFANQFNQRWSGADLSPRERALSCAAVDVLNQTLGASAGGRIRYR
jgi:hypothetical protein